jgi:hypothetical protein
MLLSFIRKNEIFYVDNQKDWYNILRRE